MADPNYEALSAMGGWSILAAASRCILSDDRRSLVGFLRGLILALFVGIIVGQLIQDYGLTPQIQNALVGIASFVADDILLMILTVSAAIRKDPKEAFLNFIEYVFGSPRDKY